MVKQSANGNMHKCNGIMPKNTVIFTTKCRQFSRIKSSYEQDLGLKCSAWKGFDSNFG